MNLYAAGVRIDGFVSGYVLSADLGQGKLEKCLRGFRKDQVLDGDASLSEVIHVLTRHNHCFVSLLGSVAGIITRSDIASTKEEINIYSDKQLRYFIYNVLKCKVEKRTGKGTASTDNEALQDLNIP